MNRSVWLVLLMFFSATAVGAGWFAVNAPEASRPSFADLGAVRLPKESPPLPPAPLSRPRGKGFETVLRRPLFSASGSRKAAGSPVALGKKGVGYREVLAPVAPSPGMDLAEVATLHSPRDDFQAAFGIPKPAHKQFFGGHLMNEGSGSADGAPPPAGTSVLETPPDEQSPDFAPVPRPRPEDVVAIAPPPQAPPPQAPPKNLTPGERAVAEAATRYDGGGSALSPEDDIILLGVLLRQGKDRALIRLSSGESRRVGLGDTVAGWQVSSIRADSIQLKRASQTREIKVPE